MKTFRYLLIVSSFFSLLILTGCSFSTGTFGDKSLSQSYEEQEAIRQRVSDYQKKIDNLLQSNEDVTSRLAEILVDSTTSESVARYRMVIAANDSLIAVYRAKIHRLENEGDRTLLDIAAKNEHNSVVLESTSAREISEAYFLIKYADNLATGNISTLTGIVANNTSSEVSVKVVGPMNFRWDYVLKARQKSPEFTLPCPGWYTATFTNGYDDSSVKKEVGPRIFYFDIERDKQYAFIATLIN
ncbi:MAG: hypothetical protein WC453_04790 [Patescibacteria group bacterium]